MKLLKTKALLERIAELQAEVDALIDARTATLKASNDCKQLPIGILRQEITRHDHRQCRIAKRLLEPK